MAIIAGLNKASITRLKVSFKDVPAKQLLVLNIYVEERGTRKRDGAKQFIQKISAGDTKCATAMHSLYWDYTDRLLRNFNAVTYTDDGNPDTINGLINFEKREQTAKLISELLYYQQAHYQIAKKLEIYNLLKNLPEASAAKEKENWNLSKSLE